MVIKTSYTSRIFTTVFDLNFLVTYVNKRFLRLAFFISVIGVRVIPRIRLE